MHENRCKHYMDKCKNAKRKQIKDSKYQNNPGSSHHYTQRQLALERQLKVACPQANEYILKTYAICRIQILDKTGHAYKLST